MKKLSFLILASCISVLTQAQTIDDALNFNQRDVTGTARSMSMANAFGALGGDQTAIVNNPAGVGVYRSSEFTFTPSYSYTNSTGRYGDFTTSNDASSFPLNQIGVVSTQKPMREVKKGLVSSSFAITYTRTADFNKNTRTLLNDRAGAGQTFLDGIRETSDGIHPDELGDTQWHAYQTFLTDDFGENQYFNAYEEYIDDDNVLLRNTRGIEQQQLLESDGYSGEYGFAYGANISNVFYIGASVNLSYLRYNQVSTYREINRYGLEPEYNTDLDYFDNYERISQRGVGVNGKLGMILNLHPLRLGASIHSPTAYSIEETYQNGIDAYYLDREKFSSTYGQSAFEYNYRTPYRLQGSAALVLGRFAAVSAEYEMADYTFSKISSADGSYVRDFEDLNNQFKEDFQIAHTARLGVEIKPAPYLALRAGAAYMGSPLKSIEGIPDPSKYITSAGFGIRHDDFFFDLAYSATHDKYDMYIKNEFLEFNELANISNWRHHVAMTFGWKF